MRQIIAAIGAFVAAVSFAAAQTGSPPPDIELTPGHARMVRVPNSFKTIIIGDPKVVEATAQSDRLLTLTPIGTGTTNLFILDDAGNELYSANVIVSASVRRRVQLFTKKESNLYWTYYCTEYSCTRMKDEFEGDPVTAAPAQNNTIIVAPSVPAAAPPRRPANQID